MNKRVDPEKFENLISDYVFIDENYQDPATCFAVLKKLFPYKQHDHCMITNNFENDGLFYLHQIRLSKPNFAKDNKDPVFVDEQQTDHLYFAKDPHDKEKVKLFRSKQVPNQTAVDQSKEIIKNLTKLQLQDAWERFSKNVTPISVDFGLYFLTDPQFQDPQKCFDLLEKAYPDKKYYHSLISVDPKHEGLFDFYKLRLKGPTKNNPLFSEANTHAYCWFEQDKSKANMAYKLVYGNSKPDNDQIKTSREIMGKITKSQMQTAWDNFSKNHHPVKAEGLSKLNNLQNSTPRRLSF